jgi:hypothetical protein
MHDPRAAQDAAYSTAVALRAAALLGASDRAGAAPGGTGRPPLPLPRRAGRARGVGGGRRPGEEAAARPGFAVRAITVRSGKGGRDRVTVRADSVAPALEQHLAVLGARPAAARAGRGGGAAERGDEAGHVPRVPALVRHAPAAPLGGRLDIRRVQELLGHTDVSTTMIYTHALTRGGRAVRSPADARQTRPAPAPAAVSHWRAVSVAATLAAEIGCVPGGDPPVRTGRRRRGRAVGARPLGRLGAPPEGRERLRALAAIAPRSQPKLR